METTWPSPREGFARRGREKVGVTTTLKMLSLREFASSAISPILKQASLCADSFSRVDVRLNPGLQVPIRSALFSVSLLSGGYEPSASATGWLRAKMERK
jgi:hypothetical protein